MILKVVSDHMEHDRGGFKMKPSHLRRVMNCRCEKFRQMPNYALNLSWLPWWWSKMLHKK